VGLGDSEPVYSGFTLHAQSEVPTPEYRHWLFSVRNGGSFLYSGGEFMDGT